MNSFRSLRWVLMLTLPVLIAACSKSGDQKTADESEEDFITSVRQEATQVSTAESVAPAPQAVGTPKIELQTTAYDMGIVPGNAIAIQKMKVFNRGDAPLKIDRISTSCGCTTGEMEQLLIAAGGEGNLIIRVDPKKIPGFYANKVLTVYSNDPVNPNPTINVVTHVQPEVEFEPETLDIGRVELGAGLKTTVRLRQLQDAPLEVSSVVFQRDPPFLRASSVLVPEAEWRTPGKREYLITVDVLAEAPAQEYDEWIILSTNLERTAQLPYKFKGVVVGPYDLAPRSIALRAVEPGQVRTDVLMLTGKEEVKIIEVANSNTSVKVSHRAGDKPTIVAFDVIVPERTPTPSLRDTWKIVFEMGGKRYEDSVPVIIILAREN